MMLDREEEELQKLFSQYSIKRIPDSLMKDYLSGVRSKIQAEKMKSPALGIPAWLWAVSLSFGICLVFAVGVWWYQTSLAVKPSIPASQPEIAMRERPSIDEVVIESDVELAAILSLLGEDVNFLEDQDLLQEVERLDRWDIQIKGSSLKT